VLVLSRAERSQRHRRQSPSQTGTRRTLARVTVALRTWPTSAANAYAVSCASFALDKGSGEYGEADRRRIRDLATLTDGCEEVVTRHAEELAAELAELRDSRDAFKVANRWTPEDAREAVADWLPGARTAGRVHAEALATGSRDRSFEAVAEVVVAFVTRQPEFRAWLEECVDELAGRSPGFTRFSRRDRDARLAELDGRVRELELELRRRVLERERAEAEAQLEAEAQTAG
jgi:hypothetical protein